MASAIERNLYILQSLATARSPLTVSELSEWAGLPKQTVQRMVVELRRLGAVQLMGPSNRIGMGPTIRDLAVNALSTHQVSSITRPILDKLVGALEETCNIGVLSDGEIVYIDRLECSWPLRVQLQPGSRVPVHCTAIGKLLLAYQSRQYRDHLVTQQPLRRYTPQTITDPRELESHLADIRQQGMSINREEDCPGLMALAVPIMDHAGNVAAGVAVHAPLTRLPPKRVKDVKRHLEAAAESLSAGLFSQAHGGYGCSEETRQWPS